ncbi:hypothetical protein L211DRAFT_868529 [Terfezia boudieri ATCC MYA-4762]|uniref:Peptidase C13 family protein n=1 Tax=Terfezia boudieri ATCC MYA-4762 TaxID=1051890 RepID=A0A3N4LL81_9PEZI|nr:hypothetical protein L211DRAFT_868529 [Terfezia boudieri ATCC MYA-4762]
MPQRKGTLRGTFRRMKQQLKNHLGYGEQLERGEGMLEDGAHEPQQRTNIREIEGQKEEEEAEEEETRPRLEEGGKGSEIRPVPEKGENQEQQGNILGPEDANPTGDGWFAADFALLNQLLRGLGKSQTWITTIDFDQAIREFGPILHGNPHRQRKIVYGAQDQTLENISMIALGIENLLNALELVLEATSPGDKVLLIYCGHGDPDTKGFNIGEVDILTPERFRHVLTKYIHKNLSVSLLLTSCYAGGWILNPNVNATILAAADNESESDSWNRSASGRFAGGLFIEAVAKELVRTATPSYGSGGSPPASFERFSSGVESTVEELFSLAAKPVFQVKDTKDATDIQQAFGISFATDLYLKRFLSLPRAPPNPHPHNMTDRQRGNLIRRWPPQVYDIVTQYEFLRPGDETKPSNMRIATLISCFKEGILMDRDAITLWHSTRYRVLASMLADVYIPVLGLRPFRPFSMFDQGEWRTELKAKQGGGFFQAVIDCHIFPGPTLGGINRPFIKLYQYIAAAGVDKGLDLPEFKEKLRNLAFLLQKHAGNTNEAFCGSVAC